MTFEEVKPQIEEILNNDNLYDALRDARAEIDDAVNGGKDLAETGKCSVLNRYGFPVSAKRLRLKTPRHSLNL